MRIVTASQPDTTDLAVLTTADVARLSGFSTKTVLRGIRAGELVASKVRGEYRVWPDDYRRWIDSRRVSPVEIERGNLAAVARVGSVSRLRALETKP